MKPRGTGAPWLACLHSNARQSSLAPIQSSIIRGFAKYRRAGLTLDKIWLKGCQVGRAMADIGEATTCNRSKSGRIILISREWFPTCLIYYCPRDQHRYHPRLGLLDSKFIALSLPHFFLPPLRRKKIISPVLFSLTLLYTQKKKYNRHKLERVGNSESRRVGGIADHFMDTAQSAAGVSAIFSNRHSTRRGSQTRCLVLIKCIAIFHPSH